MNKICYGCGVKLQVTDEFQVGYVPSDKLAEAKYCQRCFRMMHYGEVKPMKTPKTQKEIINKINKDKRFVIFLVDYLNINADVINLFHQITKNKVLVVNKCELLPEHIKKERIIPYLRRVYGVKEPIKLKGGNKNRGASSILEYLLKENIKEAYIVGISNSGKSTLINDLITITNTHSAKITVNDAANTTLDFIRVNLPNIKLIDSPGFILNAALKTETNKEKVGSYTYNMKAGETLALLNEQYFLKFDAPTAITFYTNFHSKGAIKKYYRAADGLTKKMALEHANMDVVLKGLGFIAVKNPVNITTNIPLESCEVRASMFGEYYE